MQIRPFSIVQAMDAAKKMQDEAKRTQAIRKQLQYVRRNVDTIKWQTEQGAKLDGISEDLERKLSMISRLYD